MPYMDSGIPKPALGFDYTPPSQRKNPKSIIDSIVSPFVPLGEQNRFMNGTWTQENPKNVSLPRDTIVELLMMGLR